MFFIIKYNNLLGVTISGACVCGCIYSPLVDVTIVLVLRRLHKQTVVL
jgi:hypothetical protein